MDGFEIVQGSGGARRGRLWITCALFSLATSAAVAAAPKSSDGVKVIGDQFYVSGVVHDFTGQGGAAGHDFNQTKPNSTGSNATRDIGQAIDALMTSTPESSRRLQKTAEDWDNELLETAEDWDNGLSSQSTGPVSFGSIGSGRSLETDALGQLKMPVVMSMLETAEDWDDYWDDGSNLLVKEASEKAEMMARDVDERGDMGEGGGAEMIERTMQDIRASPDNLAEKKATAALKKVKMEQKKILKREDADIDEEVQKGKKAQLAVEDKDDKFQGMGFEDDKKAQAKFAVNATLMAWEWDDAMTMGPPPKPEFSFPGTQGPMKRDGSGGESVAWPVKVGLIKNFPVNQQMVQKTIATVPDMHAVAVANIKVGTKVKNVAFVVHGHRISRVNLDNGQIDPLAGSTDRGFANGVGTVSRFNDPRDVAIFRDPKNRDEWMLLVADSNNDQLRLVRDPLGKGNVTTVLENATVEIPHKVAVVESRQNSPDQNATNARKIFAFLICGKRTVVRVENILGRRKVVAESRAYESDWDRKQRLSDKTIYNEDAKATVHLLSSGFLHLTDIAVLKEEMAGSERIVAFVVDKEAGKLFRLERIIAGEQQARVVEVGSMHNDVGPFETIQAHNTWFGIAGQAGSNQFIHRIDQISEGMQEGRTSLLQTLREAGQVRSLAVAPSGWKGKFYMIVDSKLSSKLPSAETLVDDEVDESTAIKSKLIEVDTTLQLICKDKTMLGSSEFNELGELQNLGLVKQDSKALDLKEWVGMTPVANQTKWQVVLFRADEGSVCGVGFTIAHKGSQSSTPTIGSVESPEVFGYYCDKGACLPT